MCSTVSVWTWSRVDIGARHGDKERSVYLDRVAQHALINYKTHVRVGTNTDRFLVTTRGQEMTDDTVTHAITEVTARSGVERLHAQLLTSGGLRGER